MRRLPTRLGVLLAFAAVLVGCRTFRPLPQDCDHYVVVDRLPAQVVLEDLESSGSVGVEDAVRGHWLVFEYELREEWLRIEFTTRTGGNAMLTVGYDTAGEARFGIGGLPDLDGAFVREPDGSVTLRFEAS